MYAACQQHVASVLATCCYRAGNSLLPRWQAVATRRATYADETAVRQPVLQQRTDDRTCTPDRQDLARSSMTQSAGALMFSSSVTEPMESATIRPDMGFLMLVMAPRMSA